MTHLEVTHRSLGSESFLLRIDGRQTLIYDRFAKTIREVQVPARFVGRASWISFDGDPNPIVDEVLPLLDTLHG
jgi:hypothetical protein